MTEIITVTGNIATEPEQRTIGEGVRVTSFRLASPHRRYDRGTGKWVDQYTNFFTVSAFRGLGEHAYASLHQGDRVIVTGRLRLRDWDNGTRSGTNADIDADAIGHDLLWGTTSYQRAGLTSGAPAPAPEDEHAPGERPTAATDSDGWTIPAAPALVGASSEPASPREAETPF
jgi:single-strand DNA-binding protein